MSPPAEILTQLSKTCAMLERHLAGSLRAVYLFGSAVDGGLKPSSDIDLLVATDTPLADPVRRALVSDLLSVSAKPGTSSLHRALEVTVVVLAEVVPWRYPPMRELQFGEWLRDGLEHGHISLPVADPDLAILLTQVRRRSLCLSGTVAAELFDDIPRKDFVQALADAMTQWSTASAWQGDERNGVLALARIWYSASTGLILPKDAAAEWALKRLPVEYRPTLATARNAYRGSGPDDLANRIGEVAKFARYVQTMMERDRICYPPDQ